MAGGREAWPGRWQAGKPGTKQKAQWVRKWVIRRGNQKEEQAGHELSLEGGGGEMRQIECPHLPHESFACTRQLMYGSATGNAEPVATGKSKWGRKETGDTSPQTIQQRSRMWSTETVQKSRETKKLKLAHSNLFVTSFCTAFPPRNSELNISSIWGKEGCLCFGQTGTR